MAMTPRRTSARTEPRRTLTLRRDELGGRAPHAGRGTDTDDARQEAGDDEVQAGLAALDGAEASALGHALATLGTSAYGVCTDCGVGISAARLALEPEAMRCLLCQIKAESAA
jgi:DnaK suppressor protein